MGPYERIGIAVFAGSSFLPLVADALLFGSGIHRGRPSNQGTEYVDASSAATRASAPIHFPAHQPDTEEKSLDFAQLKHVWQHGLPLDPLAVVRFLEQTFTKAPCRCTKEQQKSAAGSPGVDGTKVQNHDQVQVEKEVWSTSCCEKKDEIKLLELSCRRADEKPMQRLALMTPGDLSRVDTALFGFDWEKRVPSETVYRHDCDGPCSCCARQGGASSSRLGHSFCSVISKETCSSPPHCIAEAPDDEDDEQDVVPTRRTRLISEGELSDILRGPNRPQSEADPMEIQIYARDEEDEDVSDGDDHDLSDHPAPAMTCKLWRATGPAESRISPWASPSSPASLRPGSTAAGGVGGGLPRTSRTTSSTPRASPPPVEPIHEDTLVVQNAGETLEMIPQGSSRATAATSLYDSSAPPRIKGVLSHPEFSREVQLMESAVVDNREIISSLKRENLLPNLRDEINLVYMNDGLCICKVVDGDAQSCGGIPFCRHKHDKQRQAACLEATQHFFEEVLLLLAPGNGMAVFTSGTKVYRNPHDPGQVMDTQGADKLFHEQISGALAELEKRGLLKVEVHERKTRSAASLLRGRAQESWVQRNSWPKKTATGGFLNPTAMVSPGSSPALSPFTSPPPMWSSSRRRQRRPSSDSASSLGLSSPVVSHAAFDVERYHSDEEMILSSPFPVRALQCGQTFGEEDIEPFALPGPVASLSSPVLEGARIPGSGTTARNSPRKRNSTACTTSTPTSSGALVSVGAPRSCGGGSSWCGGYSQAAFPFPGAFRRESSAASTAYSSTNSMFDVMAAATSSPGDDDDQHPGGYILVETSLFVISRPAETEKTKAEWESLRERHGL
ncbi:unnamed protein product [Amoebophrya sp. A120]|nr:unnamed protein product [Amoebophrya sp. A120]|eukprot:GSA120T00018472001.1